MFNFFRKNDVRIQEDVKNELAWDPSVTSSDISVEAKDGIVTLSGTVPHYAEKGVAEKAAQRVGGVKGIADEIDVNLGSTYKRRDADIVEAANYALEWNYRVPDGIKVSVDRGAVTLRGEAEWDYERAAAKDTVGKLMGVRAVSCEIKLKSHIQAADVKECIENALKRFAESEGQEVSVEVDGKKVILTGSVSSLEEVEQARVAAWSAIGVMDVENNLTVLH